MNTKQIHEALANDPAVGPHFLGVFACDKVPVQIKKFPAALVVNTDPSSASGEHWVAFYFDHKGNAEYFDSYGLAPINCDLLQFFERNGKITPGTRSNCRGFQVKCAVSGVLLILQNAAVDRVELRSCRV